MQCPPCPRPENTRDFSSLWDLHTSLSTTGGPVCCALNFPCRLILLFCITTHLSLLDQLHWHCNLPRVTEYPHTLHYTLLCCFELYGLLLTCCESRTQLEVFPTALRIVSQMLWNPVSQQCAWFDFMVSTFPFHCNFFFKTCNDWLAYLTFYNRWFSWARLGKQLLYLFRAFRFASKICLCSPIREHLVLSVSAIVYSIGNFPLRFSFISVS